MISVDELGFSDLWDPYNNYREGMHYLLTFSDSYCRILWVLCTPSKIAQDYSHLLLEELKRLGYRLEWLHYDKGKEYLPMKLCFKEISFTKTEAYTQKHNGAAEHINHSLKEPETAILIAAKITTTYWADAIHMAVRLLNKLPHTSVSSTPYQLVHEKVPDVKY